MVEYGFRKTNMLQMPKSLEACDGLMDIHTVAVRRVFKIEPEEFQSPGAAA